MIDAEVLNLMEQAPVEFDAFCSQPANRARLQTLEQALEGIATGADRLAAYMGQRHGYGCGDQGHDRAVRESNKVVATVRRAFGYHVTHPVIF
jgi:hypothetical protein